MNIINLTKEHLFEIANISTGGYFKSDFAYKQKEIETGGYGKRRLLEWIIDDEFNYFEINGEDKSRGWHWYAWCIDHQGKKHSVNCLNFSKVVDYCDNLDIEVRSKKNLKVGNYYYYYYGKCKRKFKCVEINTDKDNQQSNFIDYKNILHQFYNEDMYLNKFK